MLSGETASQSDFSSSEEDELNRNDLNRTIQGTSGALQIKDLIGRGAFGSVYKASWKGLPAAVKVHLVCTLLDMREGMPCMHALFQSHPASWVMHAHVACVRHQACRRRDSASCPVCSSSSKSTIERCATFFSGASSAEPSLCQIPLRSAHACRS